MNQKVSDKGEAVQTLSELGLSVSMAKLYIALLKIGQDSTARTAAKFSNVARQDVYRILDELHELGLVEKIIGVPNKFRAVPLVDAVSALLERRAMQTSQLQAKTHELIRKFATSTTKATHQEGSQLVLIPNKETLFLRIKKATETAQKSI